MTDTVKSLNNIRGLAQILQKKNKNNINNTKIGHSYRSTTKQGLMENDEEEARRDDNP